MVKGVGLLASSGTAYFSGPESHPYAQFVPPRRYTYSLFGGHNGTGSVIYLGGTHANYVGGSTLTVMEVTEQ